MKARVVRIAKETDELIRKIQSEQDETYIRASKIVSDLAKNNKNRKLVREIKF